MMDSKIAIIAFGLLFAVLVDAEGWGYEDSNGPGTWNTNPEYPSCGENSQSPIDVRTSIAVENSSLPRTNRRHFYSPPRAMTLSNNGHTLVMTFGEGAYTIVDRNLLPFDAKIAQYHFHWGSVNGSVVTSGSEHLLDGEQYFGELHAVHFNTKYNNLSTAASMPDGLAVFGWFIKIGYPQTNQDVKHFLDLAEANAQYKGNQTDITMTFSLETLLPPNLDVYYRYKGSLTTPPCYESVVWTVFADPIEITSEQAEILANSFYATDTSATTLIDNFRPPQNLNGRTIYKPPAVVQDSGAAVVRSSVVLALLVSTVVYYL